MVSKLVLERLIGIQTQLDLTNYLSKPAGNNKRNVFQLFLQVRCYVKNFVFLSQLSFCFLVSFLMLAFKMDTFPFLWSVFVGVWVESEYVFLRLVVFEMLVRLVKSLYICEVDLASDKVFYHFKTGLRESLLLKPFDFVYKPSNIWFQVCFKSDIPSKLFLKHIQERKTDQKDALDHGTS